MRRLISLPITTLVFLLASCSTGPAWTFDRDALGFVWPEACRHDLADETADVPVMFVPRKVLEDYYRTTYVLPPRWSINDTVWDVGIGKRAIWIADDIAGWGVADTIQHARCHLVAGDWHPMPFTVTVKPSVIPTPTTAKNG